MRRLITGALACGALTVGGFVGVAGAVDEHAPHGGPFSHPHHVHTGNGGCVNLNEVLFEHEDPARGLHRGSLASTTAHGPWHGTCTTPHPH